MNVIGVILGIIILTMVIVIFNWSLKEKQRMDFFRKQEKDNRGAPRKP
jgi:hypothetical protein